MKMPSSLQIALGITMRSTPCLILLACSLFASIANGSDNKNETLLKDLEKAKTVHAEAKKTADEKLVKAIDSEIEAVRKSSLKAEQRLNLIGILEKEKELFEKSSWVPVTERLQKATMDHIKSVKQSDRVLDGEYEKVLDKLIVLKETDTATMLIEDRKSSLPRRLPICLEIDDGTYWSLYSDELTESQKQRWRFAKNEIVFEFLPDTPKGKPKFDIAMVIAEDGQSFHCIRGRKYTAKRVDAPKR